MHQRSRRRSASDGRLVQESMREGIYIPQRSSNLCSYKHCAFAATCEAEFGGRVKGGEEE